MDMRKYVGVDVLVPTHTHIQNKSLYYRLSIVVQSPLSKTEEITNGNDM